MSQPRIVVLIPARGGSKGIPFKNIATVRLESGRDVSLLENSVRRLSGLVKEGVIDEIWIATDSGKIAEHVMDWRKLYDPRLVLPYIYSRLPENATDEASTEDLMMEFLEEKELENIDILVTVQCTSPFIDPNVLVKAIEAVGTNRFQSALSVTRTHRFFWTRKRSSEEGLAMNYDPRHRPRRQDIKEEFFIENGAFYVTRCGNLRASGTRLPGRIYLAVQEEEYTHVEIDTLEDLEVSRKLLEMEEK